MTGLGTGPQVTVKPRGQFTRAREPRTVSAASAERRPGRGPAASVGRGPQRNLGRGEMTPADSAPSVSRDACIILEVAGVTGRGELASAGLSAGPRDGSGRPGVGEPCNLGRGASAWAHARRAHCAAPPLRGAGLGSASPAGPLTSETLKEIWPQSWGRWGREGGTGTVLIGVRNPLPFCWPHCTHHQFWRPSRTRWAPSHARGGALSQVQGALSQVQGHPATFAGAQPPPGRTCPAVDRPGCVRARTNATPGAAAPEPPAPRAPGRRGEVPGVRTAPSRPASPGREARLCTSGLPKRKRS